MSVVTLGPSRRSPRHEVLLNIVRDWAISTTPALAFSCFGLVPHLRITTKMACKKPNKTAATKTTSKGKTSTPAASGSHARQTRSRGDAISPNTILASAQTGTLVPRANSEVALRERLARANESLSGPGSLQLQADTPQAAGSPLTMPPLLATSPQGLAVFESRNQRGRHSSLSAISFHEGEPFAVSINLGSPEFLLFYINRFKPATVKYKTVHLVAMLIATPRVYGMHKISG